MHAEQQITLLINSDFQTSFIKSDSQLSFSDLDFQLSFTKSDFQLPFTKSDFQAIECTSVNICVFRDLINNEEHSITTSTASDQSDTEFKSEDIVIQDILKKTLHDMRELSDSINFISQSETSFKHISICQNETVKN
ncbi:hypothetical protein LOZ12_006774 [Ophidiomyces ophidiicola]|uniref:Uncharacterized protein n=1 Tax=Ophidiomyces ophidiicola TaxID=1387563 RepID=A0ACB8UMJ9_9EURO|nr:hypothetical protein LOZ64_006806 [Ophidiomyces ophidiicola]KAI1932493.1 hypothetical protein LOZ62_006637 [Ophidiomyces ophidiicola]KAI1998926.1 hypothetical protein LOZ50_006730 [Ophidiomyces ophidiicola]KAI2018468.1 hypothetical protein LOZ45_005850 [Ophidiomyces ophidiicola]KAI2030314.1 hypothetical protein LOZ47_006524 [Ophidiomyces ophidiicola]